MQAHARFVILCTHFPDSPLVPLNGGEGDIEIAQAEMRSLNRGECPGHHTVEVQVWLQGEWQLAEVGAP